VIASVSSANLKAARSPLKILNHLDLARVGEVAQVEFHPTDTCNQRCRGCTYGQDVPSAKPAPTCFPFAKLPLVAAFQPRSLVLTGGGEPLLYRDSATGLKLPDLVMELRRLLPEARFALLTNGSRDLSTPWSPWLDEFSWVRLSVDAARPDTYIRMRGVDAFGIVCKNLLWLLRETQIQQINLGFVYCDENIHEATEAAQFFFRHVSAIFPEGLGRICIDYRPLRQDFGDKHEEFPAAVTQGQIDCARSAFEKLAESAEMRDFLEEQTNWEVIGNGNHHAPADFSRCGYASIFRLIRADGSVWPCCMRVNAPSFCLGSILNGSTPATIAQKAAQFAEHLRPGCDAENCKLAVINRTIEDGLRGDIEPSRMPEIAENPFF
jgi:sulfatase maturation enzyme AslB (radical SAM superfamily)